MHATSAIAPPARGPAAAVDRLRGWRGLAPALLAYAVVVAVYVLFAGSALSRSSGERAADAPYNRLTDGLLAGHLYLDQPVPEALLTCPDPYDPRVLGRTRGMTYTPESIHDFSYYRGRLYLYFSVVPAALLFLPFHLLTGAYLSQQYASALLLAAGLAAVVRMLLELCRQAFPGTRPIVLAAAVIAAGLLPCTVLVAEQPDMYEVPISGAYCFTAATLFTLWRVVRTRTPSAWTVAALSTCVALAVGCRPSEIATLGVVAIGFVHAWRAGPGSAARRWRLVAAAAAPLALVGLSLLAYNFGRFGSVTEFGVRYQMSLDRPDLPFFNVRNLAFNGWMYLLHFPGWSAHFPFAGPWGNGWPMPATMSSAGHPVGLLSAAPFVLLGFVALARWRTWPAGVRWIAAACAWLFVSNGLLLAHFFSNAARYELAFAPSLVLLAILGLFSLETVLAAAAGWLRRPARVAWAAALAFSAVYAVLLAYRQRGDTWLQVALTHMWQNDQAGAIACSDRALHFDPDSLAALQLKASSEAHLQRVEDAIHDFQRILAREPQNLTALNFLASLTFFAPGRAGEAVDYFQQAVALTPNNAAAHFNLAQALLHANRPAREAILHLRVALRLRPDLRPAQVLLARLESARVLRGA